MIDKTRQVKENIGRQLYYYYHYYIKAVTHHDHQRRRYKAAKPNGKKQCTYEYLTVTVFPLRVRMPAYAARPLPKLPCHMA